MACVPSAGCSPCQVGSGALRGTLDLYLKVRMNGGGERPTSHVPTNLVRCSCPCCFLLHGTSLKSLAHGPVELARGVPLSGPSTALKARAGRKPRLCRAAGPALPSCVGECVCPHWDRTACLPELRGSSRTLHGYFTNLSRAPKSHAKPIFDIHDRQYGVPPKRATLVRYGATASRPERGAGTAISNVAPWGTAVPTRQTATAKQR